MVESCCVYCALYTSWNEGEYGIDEVCEGLFDIDKNRECVCKGWMDDEKHQTQYGYHPDLKNLETEEIIPYKEWIKTHEMIVVNCNE